MNSRRNRGDRLSSLPEPLLVLVISNLPFKEAVKTSVLAKRWKNLHRQTTNVSFKESDFVKRSVSNDEETKRDARVSFVRYMVNWVSKYSGAAIERFELCLSKPVGFETEITSLIEFAVSKQVKNLVLDFSDPSSTTGNQAAVGASVFQLPECAYSLATLESLKLFACNFDPSRLVRPGSLKSLCFGWIQLGKIMALLSKTPLLESLSIQNCSNVGLEAITEYNNRLRELIFENCSFATVHSTLDLPNIQIFKYSGKVHYFQFMQVNRRMEEAYLDFGAETEYGEETGTILCGLLYDLLSARKLTVCRFLIQMIKDSEDPVRLQAPMETRHLVIKTSMVPYEFIGIRLMINSCPDLETLTFQMLPPIHAPTTNLGFCPKTYWTYVISHKCLKKTLKVVEVRNFTGGAYELQILKFLIRLGLVLERVDLYLPVGTLEAHKTLARATVRKLCKSEASSNRLCIRLHDD
ncbi:hypothetical protein EUTSA_v10005956mg [Eutrema salsugineum]|uniref:F-box domain-containing protein n=1 Tax=Eutrema salsugineum TaxID=72664 RepID=V4LJC3_EUTSA|nr:F-box protein At3g62230 [Eutrema salsugineum]ESQ43849.1 hypothetical protein EUTSA_v10005956mg [Eutrema salsugineum]